MSSVIVTDRSFRHMFARTKAAFETHAEKVHTQRWQGGDISKRPDMVSYELRHWHCTLNMYGEENLEAWRHLIEPNLPWADDHFLERVGGEPLNPGVQWANWPWATSAEKHQVEGARFNHTYMQRLWPKFANHLGLPGGRIEVPGEPLWDDGHLRKGQGRFSPHLGIRHEYGDLEDLVLLLAKEPDTRQAWIPLFFPEDTGIGDGGRKPCTLGYQFMMRNGRLDIYYPLRSCDFVRHFRDDVYMAIRLLLWVLDRCREINPEVWKDVTPGYYVMHCTSLHIFANDYIQMFGGQR